MTGVTSDMKTPGLNSRSDSLSKPVQDVLPAAHFFPVIGLGPCEVDRDLDCPDFGEASQLSMYSSEAIVKRP